MNFDVLEQGIKDVYDHIDSYVKSACAGDVRKLDVNRDLYDFQGGKVRNFLVSLSTVVVNAYNDNARIVGQNGAWQLAYTVLLCSIVVLVSVGVVVYGYAMYKTYLKTDAVPAHLEMHAVGLAVLLASTFLICKELVTDKRVLEKTQYISLNKVPNTELLWDPSVRHIYYNTIPDPDEREKMVASDRDLSDACASTDAGSNPHSVGSMGNDCGSTLALDRDYVYKNLLPWIQHFYENKAAVLNALRYKGYDVNIQHIRDAHARLLRVLTMDTSSAAAPQLQQQQTSVDALVDQKVIPMLTARVTALPYARVVGKADMGTFTAASSNECIDQAALQRAGLAAFSAGSNTCTLYKQEPVQASTACNDIVFVLGDTYYGLLNAPRTSSGGSTKISLEPFAQLTDCISACDIDNNCNTCYTADNKRFTAMHVKQAPDKAAMKLACSNDCYFVQKQNSALLADSLASRASHLTQELAALYAQENASPSEVAARAMLKLEAMRTAPEALRAVRQILSDAEVEYRAGTRSQYATDAEFVHTLGALSGEEFLQGVVMPAYVLRKASETLSPYFLAQSDVANMRWSTQKSAMDAAVAIVNLVTVVFLWKRARDGRAWGEVAVTSVLTVSIVFFACTLLETWIFRKQKFQQARRAAQYNAGNRIVLAASELNDYLRRHSRWVGALLGLKDVYVDDATGALYSSGAPLDMRSPVLKQPLHLDALHEKALFAANVRNMAVDIDGLLTDCQDVLNLRARGFPWNEVSIIAVMVVLLLALWMFVRQKMAPGYLIERLQSLLARKHNHDFEDLNLSEGDDPWSTYVAMGLVTVVLIVLSVLCIQNVQEYQLECRRRHTLKHHPKSM